MFSHLSVSHSVHRGRDGHVWQGDLHGKGVCVAGGMHGRCVCVAGDHAWQGGNACPGVFYTAGEMATAADGTHPTGMHSCYSL